MQNWPINATKKFDLWPPFDPGRMIDFNPTHVRIADDLAFAIFRRESTPPVSGKGSIWVVQVDNAMRPCASPSMLLAQGEDPRAVLVGGRVLVFYVRPETNANGTVVGTSIALAECDVSGQSLVIGKHFLLPKNPLGGQVPAGNLSGWEKNWVPFRISDQQVGLLYAHDPWDVIVLGVDAAQESRRFEGHHRSHGVQWSYGQVRGGTPPVAFDESHLVTFFHSSLMVGSRRLYMVGACVFENRAPFRPVSFTREPLLVAPYKGGVSRFGWTHAHFGVLFPLGAECIDGDFQLLCGIDDGEIGHILIDRVSLRSRLSALGSVRRTTLHNYQGQAMPESGGPMLQVPHSVGGIAELPIIKFMDMVAGHGRTMVDVGAHIGFYTMALAPGFQRVESFEPSRFQQDWLKRNVDLNRFQHVRVHTAALGEERGEATLHVLSPDGGMNTLATDVAQSRQAIETYTCPVERLDSHGFRGVDLLKIDVEGFEMPVLRGARQTISTWRPVILIEVWDEAARREPIRALLDELGYTCEFMFSSAPELALCLPRERRHDYSWFF